MLGSIQRGSIRHDNKFSLAMGLCAAILCVASVGCNGQAVPFGEDSWGHFVQGGVFQTNSGSLKPDGSTIVFSSPRSGNGDLYTVDRVGAGLRRLTSSEDFEGSPLYTPDGRHIVFAREENHRRHLWIMDAGGSNAQALTFGDVLDDPQEFSSDGGQLMFRRAAATYGMGKHEFAYALNMNRPGEQPALIGHTATFGPAGESIAYNPPGQPDEVWLKRKTDPKPLRLTLGTEPRFSPDGKFLAVRRARQTGKWERDMELWGMDMDHSGETRVGVGHSQCFLGDSRRIVYYSGYECRVWVYDMLAKTTTEVACSRGFKTQPERALNGNSCLIRVVSTDRIGDILLFDGVVVQRVLTTTRMESQTPRNNEKNTDANN